MNSIKKLVERGCFALAYEELRKEDNITLELICKKFEKTDNRSVVLFLIYIIATEQSEDNIILLFDYLMYIEPPCDDIHLMIKLFSKLQKEHSSENKVFRWIVDTYESHPDSPFSNEEIVEYKRMFT